jgi:hypothetical protein
MSIKYEFDAPFKVRIPERSDWEVQIPSKPGALVFYTDGSIKDGSTGLGIFGPLLRYHEALGTTPTIFQAEMYAINVCVRLCSNRVDIEGHHVYIMSSSNRRSKSTIICSKLTVECFDTLNDLSSKCNVTIRWLPGHNEVIK